MHAHTSRIRGLVGGVAIVVGAVLTAAGCSSSGGSTGPKTGSLAVTITTPTGVTPAITVSGPGGYNKALSATTTLTGLTAGSYTVTAAAATDGNAIVTTVDTATISGSPATVTANSTATTSVTYAPRPGSGGMWIANFAVNSVVQYTAAQLSATTAAPPATALGTSANGVGVAVDAAGNLWVARHDNQVVAEYSVSQLGSSQAVAAADSLLSDGTSLTDPSGLAFDAQGNLWVADQGDSSIQEFTPAQLAAGGSPTPAVIISASAGSLQQPFGLAFDKNGNLWVSNATGNTLVEFTSSQLATSGSPTPAVTLTAASNSIVGPLLIAFNATGNLWVPNSFTGYNTIVEFAASQLVASGSPTPAVTLTEGAGIMRNPSGLAFDASGDLWVANGGGSVVEFTASQLATSGSPTPAIVVSGSSLGFPWGLAFDPPAKNLPLTP